MPLEGSSLYYALLGLMQTTTSVVVLIRQGRSHADAGDVENDVGRGDGEEQTVRPVEHAAVAGDQVGEILDVDHTLHQAFRQVADLAHRGGQEAGDETERQVQLRENGKKIDDQTDCQRGECTADRAFPGFFRADF